MSILILKKQIPKTKIYYDLFYDASDVSIDINSQYFYTRINEKY